MTVEHALRVTLATGSLLLVTGIVLNNSISKTAGAVLVLLCCVGIVACVIVGVALVCLFVANVLKQRRCIKSEVNHLRKYPIKHSDDHECQQISHTNN